MTDSKSKAEAPEATAAVEKPIAITFDRPDVMSEIPEHLLETWGGDPFLAIKNVGFFLRVVLRVKLTDGGEVHFGTWLEVKDEEWRTAWQTWNFPEYANLVVNGFMGNVIEPWGQFPHLFVEAKVRDLEEVPVISRCTDEQVTAIIDGTWDRDYVLAPYADVLAPSAPQKPAKRARSGKGSRRLPEIDKKN